MVFSAVQNRVKKGENKVFSKIYCYPSIWRYQEQLNIDLMTLEMG